jgi:hypothetical protein
MGVLLETLFIALKRIKIICVGSSLAHRVQARDTNMGQRGIKNTFVDFLII